MADAAHAQLFDCGGGAPERSAGTHGDTPRPSKARTARVTNTPPGASHMITEYVLFDLPSGISREEVVAGMHEVAPRWQKEPKLIRKTFVFDPQANQAGAFYLWADRASAEAAHDEAWRQRIRTTYKSEPRIRYFDTPLVVDNALGKLFE
jgi:hypothetical protein